MKIPFAEIAREYADIKIEIDAAVGRVLTRGCHVLGPELEAFEAEFAAYLGVKASVGVASGTEAITVALAAAGAGAGDEVVTVSHTAVPTATAISMLGAIPVYVDVDRDSRVMNASLVEQAITARTKAIVPVHLYGHCVDMDPLLAVARKRGIPVIEDCAQAHGATYKGRLAGTMGDFGAFSFYPSKNLGCYGDGGAIVTNDPAQAEKLKMLRNYGQKVRYHNEIKGFNSRLDEIQAAVLRVKLVRLDRWNDRRREIARRYTQALAGSGLVTPLEKTHAKHVYHLYVIESDDRDFLQKELAEAGIATLIHYPVPVHLQPAYRDVPVRHPLPVTEKMANRILSLPMFPQMTDEETDYVITAVQNALQGALK